MNELEKKYFVDGMKFNCPLCETNSIPFKITRRGSFDWAKDKVAYYFVIRCTGCDKSTFHLSWKQPYVAGPSGGENFYNSAPFNVNDLDDYFFYSVPRSQFISDNRMPEKIRNLLFEADGCLHSNYLTGASGCIRKAIYELLVLEGLAIKGKKTEDYAKLIKSLKDKYSNIDPTYFDILAHIQGIASDQLHENAWEEMKAKEISLLLETLKTILFEIKIEPLERQKRKEIILDLKKKTDTKNISGGDTDAQKEK